MVESCGAQNVDSASSRLTWGNRDAWRSNHTKKIGFVALPAGPTRVAEWPPVQLPRLQGAAWVEPGREPWGDHHGGCRRWSESAGRFSDGYNSSPANGAIRCWIGLVATNLVAGRDRAGAPSPPTACRRPGAGGAGLGHGWVGKRIGAAGVPLARANDPAPFSTSSPRPFTTPSRGPRCGPPGAATLAGLPGTVPERSRASCWARLLGGSSIELAQLQQLGHGDGMRETKGRHQRGAQRNVLDQQGTRVRCPHRPSRQGGSGSHRLRLLSHRGHLSIAVPAANLTAEPAHGALREAPYEPARPERPEPAAAA